MRAMRALLPRPLPGWRLIRNPLDKSGFRIKPARRLSDTFKSGIPKGFSGFGIRRLAALIAALRLARPRPDGTREKTSPRLTLGGMLLGLGFVLVLAGIVHLVSILTMPVLAKRGAFQRLSAIAVVNEMTLLPAPTAEGATLPMTDPAFISAVCLYDLTDHPLKVRVPATPDYTSVSFYTQHGASFYALNDQAAGRGIELELLSPAQRAALPEDEEITAADRLIVESPSIRGMVLIRAFARYPDLRDAIRRQLEAASCEPSA